MILDKTPLRSLWYQRLQVTGKTGSALNKLMSTKFPSSALLMELSVFLKKSKKKAPVEWAPRESNKEADALANGVTDVSTPSSR